MQDGDNRGETAGARRWMRTPDAAEHTGLAAATMKSMRARGRGPRWRKIGGAVVYDVRDLDFWLERPGTIRETSDTLDDTAARRRRVRA